MIVDVQGNHFCVDGEPIRIISGAMHYFRTHPDQWRDRLRKLRACGLNTVETYVAWNLHEPEPGVFCFDGFCGIQRFVREAGEEGMMVIVRPGPYICAEWEAGGLPWWLHTIAGCRPRCFNEPYLACVDRFFDALLSRLAPLQCTRGGPMIAMQVENEYGSYGSDARYLRYLRDGMQARGIDVLLFTSDGPEAWMLNGGTLPNTLKTANFGSGAEGTFGELRRHQPTGPLMCMEFWNGWFDQWGKDHHTRAADDAARALDEILKMGASVNIYMFHGGTTFGFMNGANIDETVFEPTITSYDYDAPLTEAGDITPKYEAFRAIIAKYVELPAGIEIGNSAKRAYGCVAMNEAAPLLDNLPIQTRITCAHTLSMEEVGQGYGFILYRHTLRTDWPATPVYIDGLYDRAVILVNGIERGVLDRKSAAEGLTLAFTSGDVLGILVENMGRVNYGPQMHNPAGIAGHVRFGQQLQYDWEIYPLPMAKLDGLSFTPVGKPIAGPAFYRGVLSVDTVADTFLSMAGWRKGVVFVNGFNLGRYWGIGPQKTLYVPAPILRSGDNEVIVFDMHGPEHLRLDSLDIPQID